MALVVRRRNERVGYGEGSALSDEDAGCRHSRSYVKDEDAVGGVEIRQNTPSNCATYHYVRTFEVVRATGL